MVFPTSPVVGQVFSSGGRSWVWNGSTWDSPRTDNPPLAIPTGNAIINGAFDIWQRGTSFTVPNQGFPYTADRFIVYNVQSAGTCTVSRQTFTPGSAPVAGYEGEYFLRIATASGTSTFNLGHPIEDVRTFAGQTVTVSYWARATSAVTLQTFLQQNFGSGGSAQVNTNDAGIAIGTSWARYTTTIAVPSVSGRTIGTSSNLMLILNYLSGTAAGNTIDFWGIQVEAGTVATPFKRNAPSIQAELAACQRYYQRYAGGVGCGLTGMAPGTTQFLANFSLPIHMRAIPTFFAAGTISISDQYSADFYATVSPGAFQGGTNYGGRVYLDGFTGLTVGRYYSTPATTIGSGYLEFRAEL
jgi:hypothetical protein